MKKQSAPKQKPYYVPYSIQRLFTYTIIILYLLQTGFIAISTLSQLQNGSDFRPQLGYFLVYNLVPIVVFLLAYVLNPRNLSRLSRTFEALLISIAAYIGWTLTAMFLPMLFIHSNFHENYRLYDYLSAAVFLCIYATILVALRKRDTWS